MYNNYNKSLLDGTFPEELKTAKVAPFYKNKNCTDKNNYRPVNIWSNISKIYGSPSTIKCMTIMTEFS